MLSSAEAMGNLLAHSSVEKRASVSTVSRDMPSTVAPADPWLMLPGQHDGLNAYGLTIGVPHGYLTFGVRLET
jgi:hypothetical protein